MSHFQDDLNDDTAPTPEVAAHYAEDQATNSPVPPVQVLADPYPDMLIYDSQAGADYFLAPPPALPENPATPEPEPEVLYVNKDPSEKQTKTKFNVLAAVEIAETEAGPPDDEYIQVRDEEGRSLSKFIGSQPNPLARGASAQPERKRGNRRRGGLRAAKKGRATPAEEDPIILRRRAIAMPLWNRGYTAGEIRLAVNTWLEAEGLAPISEETIRKDKLAIIASWERDYDESSAMNRSQHIAAINRIKSEAWHSYEQLRDGQQKTSLNASTYLRIALQAESELATLDGSKKRAEVSAAQSAHQEGATKITRVYLGVNLEETKGE